MAHVRLALIWAIAAGNQKYMLLLVLMIYDLETFRLIDFQSMEEKNVKVLRVINDHSHEH